MRATLSFFLAIALLVVGRAIAADSALQTQLKDPPLGANWIYDDLPRAMAEAKATGKPICAEVRCVPCPPGKKIDTEVTHPDAELEKLESKFVCVRVIQTNGLDLKAFQYDYDQSITFMFLNADGTTYGRYGTRIARREHSEDFYSIASLSKSMERVLELHKGYPANKDALQGKQGHDPAYRVPEEIPGLTDHPHVATGRDQCIHCHMVREAIIRAKWTDKKLLPVDLFAYPMPGNIGMTMDVDDALRIKSIAPNSAASAAGLLPGDELLFLNSQPLISIADIQWVLNGVPDETSLRAKLLRHGKTIDLSIALNGQWRRSDITWRKTTAALHPGLFLEPLSPDAKAKKGIAPSDLALNVRFLYAPRAQGVVKAGLKAGDVIVAVDGNAREVPEGEIFADLHLSRGPGDTFKVTILRGTERQELTLPLW